MTVSSAHTLLWGLSTELPDPTDPHLPREGTSPLSYLCVDTLQVFQSFLDGPWLLTVTLPGSDLHRASGAPVDGTTLAGIAEPGALLVTDEPALYQNTGTKDDPTWATAGGSSIAGLSSDGLTPPGVAVTGNVGATSETLSGPGGAAPTHVSKQKAGQTGYLYAGVGSDTFTKFSVGVDGEVLTTDDVLAPLGTVKGKVLEIVQQATAGAPTTGAHNAGEFYADTAGGLFYCLTGGTPGVWTAVTFNAAANTFTIGPQTFQSGAADHIAAIDQAAAGQTANIREVRDSTGQVLVKVDAHGNLVTVTLDPPAAPTLGAAPVGDVTGIFKWACALVNAQGRTDLGATTVYTSLTAQQQSLTMPVAAPDGCTFTLYRTQASGLVFQEVVTGLAPGAVYVDDTLDGALGSAAPVTNTTGPGAALAGILTALQVRAGVSYAVVAQDNGQNFTHGAALAPFTIDGVTFLSSDFSASVGGTTVTLNEPGLYLAIVDAYQDDTPLATGRIECRTAILPTHIDVLVEFLPCIAELTDGGQALMVHLFLIAAAPATVGFTARQTSGDDHLLGGDLFIMRIGNA